MGDRGEVKLIYGEYDNPIYLYTCWGAHELLETLRAALERGRSRWNDSSYLARIIFSEMIKDEVMDKDGYGIHPRHQGDVWRVVEVDLINNTVAVIDRNEDAKAISFEEFLGRENL